MLLILGLQAQGAPPSLEIPNSTTASPAANNPGRQLLEQMQRTLPLRRAPVTAPPEEKAAAPDPDEPKFFIHQIEVSGVTRLSQKQVRGIVQPYENKPLGLSDINVLLESLTRAYVKKGYATTRVYLPRQNIGKGVLQLQVVEGTWSRFLRPRSSEASYSRHFPTQPGKIVKLPDPEQGLDQIERATSVRVKAEFEKAARFWR